MHPLLTGEAVYQVQPDVLFLSFHPFEDFLFSIRLCYKALLGQLFMLQLRMFDRNTSYAKGVICNYRKESYILKITIIKGDEMGFIVDFLL